MAIKLKTLLDMSADEMEALSPQQLQAAADRAYLLASNRLHRLQAWDATSEAAGSPVYSPALRAVQEPGRGLYKAKDATAKELQKSLDSTLHFLRMKTSMPSRSRISWERIAEGMTKEEMEMIWAALDKARRKHGSDQVKAYVPSAKIIEALRKRVRRGQTQRTLNNFVERAYNKAYEQAQQSGTMQALAGTRTKRTYKRRKPR